MQPLKLIALDQDDIAVVSTHLQDAVVKVADIVWLPPRSGWSSAEPVRLGSLRRGDPCYQRRRTALRFERVMSFRCRNVNPAPRTRAQPAGGRIRRDRRPAGP
jgi:hypothetical protein